MSEKELTKPGVFIIESLTFKNEQDQRHEGQLIAHILELNQIQSQYYYIRTKKELEKVLRLFYDSEYRYLHLSCHGDINCVYLTLDTIPYRELGQLLEINLYKKRLFLSACQATNEKLTREVIPTSGCYSIIGPVNTIEFRDAAITWAAFYYMMFRNNSKNMFRKDLIKSLQKTVNAFDQPMNYFSISHKEKKGYKKKLLQVQQVKVATQEEEY